MTIDQIIYLFESLLVESRVIFISKSLEKLSSCINAANAMLNPFSWQYVFIPVLPSSLLDYCCAPMPFIIGILANSYPKLMNLPLEEVVFIDLDKRTFSPHPQAILHAEIRDEINVALHKIKSVCHIGKFTFFPFFFILFLYDFDIFR